ncbi:hypothetical protein PTKIN_Ptkin08bG0157400 [Pterospermum kingtungense]
MQELLLNIHQFHQWCTEILEKCQCTFQFKGPWLAYMNMLVTCDPASIHYIMSSNFNNFPKGSECKQIFDILGDGIFNADMDLWRKQESCSRVVNLEDVFQRFSFDSTCILVTGYDPGCLSVEFPEVVFSKSKALDDAEEAIFYRHVRSQSFVKLQKWLNVGQEKKYKKAWQVLDDVIGKYICQKRKNLKDGLISENGKKGEDLLTSYITEENSTCLKCDDKFLRDTILSMMIAGRDSKSSALGSFGLFLDIQKWKPRS